MNKYTIFCTEAQTRKALELGAPIFTAPYFPQVLYEVHNFFVKDETAYYFPTAEQMIGWLEEQKEASFDIYEIYNGWTYNIIYEHSDANAVSVINYDSRQQATLAAIDAALEYLTNNKR